TEERLAMERRKAEERLANLLERLVPAGSSAGPAVSLAAPAIPGPSIDALESIITEFQYDTEDDVTFESWYERYRDIFEEETKTLEEKARVRLLLRHLSTRVNTQYRDHLAPVDVQSKTFDDTVKELKKL